MDSEGRFWYDHYETVRDDGGNEKIKFVRTYEAFRELYSLEGYLATSRVQDIENAEWIEQREEKEREIEENLKNYSKALCEFVVVDTSLGKTIFTVEKPEDYKSAAAAAIKLFAHLGTRPMDSSFADKEEFEKSCNELTINIAKGFVSIVDTAREAMNNAEAGSTAEKEAYKTVMSEQLTPLRDHMAKCPPNLEKYPELAEEYNKITPSLNLFELDQIVFLFEDYEAFDSEGKAHPALAEAAALGKVSRALSASSVPEDTEGYAELVAKIKAEEERLASVKEAKKNALGDAAKLYEYELTNNLYQKTFSKDSETMGNPNADAGEYSERVITSGEGPSGYEGYWRYVVLGNPQTPTSYASLTQTNITNGFVMSFDFMAEGTNGTHYKKATFTNEWTNAATTRLVNYGKSIFEIGYDSATDSIKIYNIAKTGVGSGADAVVPVSSVAEIAAEGQWFNVMLIYDYSTHICKLYVDYEYMFDCYMEGWVEGATRTIIRCSHQSAWQNSCYDNVTFYEGTAYRDIHKFDNMTNTEKFTYYVNYFLNDLLPFQAVNFVD
jgi:hypothetical protein